MPVAPSKNRTRSTTAPSDPVETPLPCGPKTLTDWLETHRQDLIAGWIRRVVEQSEYYRKRPLEELEWTISESFTANLQAIKTGNVETLDNFVAFITRLRLEAGFPLSEVQKAFDAYRSILLPSILSPPLLERALASLKAVNACVFYQIHRFSEEFQTRHEQAIRQHADHLEAEVKQRTRELAASENRYKTLVEEIDDGYFVVQNERITFANRAFCTMHQALPQEILGKPFRKFVAKESRALVKQAYFESQMGLEGPLRLEYQRLESDGGKSATEIKARVVNLGQGPVTIGICRDISDRVAMEEQVREHERMAYVGHLTASLSHEIRNPLSAVKMNMQILARRLPLEGYDQRRLEIMVNEVTRLEGILRQLLDLARPLAPSPTHENVNELVLTGLDLLEPKLAEKNLRTRRCLASGLPDIRLDRGMIEQALINLLLNALAVSPEGGHITVGTRAVEINQAAGVELSVRDNGPGLTARQLKQIFTPFFSGSSQGTGLGLTNVKRICEAHGGRVLVKTSPGAGAKFIMRIPELP